MRLLKQLYKIHSPSRQEDDMSAFLQEWLSIRNIPFTVDATGNILVTKGCAPFVSKPLIANHKEADAQSANVESEKAAKPVDAPKRTVPVLFAHMDQVQDDFPRDTRIMNIDGVIYGFSAYERRQVGLGADDKNGVWVCLKALEVIPVLKVAFFVGEEIGCVGSSDVDMSFFDDCMFGIQCDRRGGSDFIFDASGVPLCTDEFIRAMKIKEWGYAKARGMMTDAMRLRERGLPISVCNLSCGYYNPHTESEVTDFEELQNCLSLVLHACRTIKTPQLAPVYEPPKSSYYGYSYGGTYVYPRVKLTGFASKKEPKKEPVNKPDTVPVSLGIRSWTLNELYWELEDYMYQEVQDPHTAARCEDLLFKLLDAAKEHNNTSLEDAVLANVVSEQDAKELESLLDFPVITKRL